MITAKKLLILTMAWGHGRNNYIFFRDALIFYKWKQELIAKELRRKRILKKNIRLSRLILMVFMLTAVFTVGPATTSSAALNDIQGHWAAAAIQKMVDQGVVTGMPDGSFKPDNSISRAEFATLVVKAFKLESKSGKVFNDTSHHWAKDYIATANAYGILNGYSDIKFGPDDPITREQMAVMIVKADKLQSSGTALSFSDSNKISAWAKDAVATASANQLIKGFPDGSFQPQAGATRAQAVVVISNADSAVAPTEDTDLRVIQIN